MLPDDDKYSQSKEELLAFIDVAMGGRVAEELIYGNEDITTGCSSDLTRATDIAYKFVRNYGMGNNLLLVGRKKDLSDKLNYQIDQEVQEILHVSCL
jgi:ATP-dependent metalloprotease